MTPREIDELVRAVEDVAIAIAGQLVAQPPGASYVGELAKRGDDVVDFTSSLNWIARRREGTDAGTRQTGFRP